MVSVPLAHRWLRVVKPKQFLLGLSLHVFQTCSHFQKLFGSVRCECASRALAKQKGDFGTVHLIVYIFPLKDFALNLFFFAQVLQISVAKQTCTDCTAKILHFPVSLEL